MNERFKHLSLMAGGSHYPTINPDMQQRFGELIVEECCKVLGTETITHDGYGYNQHALYQKIREHFGI
jgi:hypothetical protein